MNFARILDFKLIYIKFRYGNSIYIYCKNNEGQQKNSNRCRYRYRSFYG